MMCCQTGNAEMLNVLLKAGANVHAATSLGDTALTIAQKSGFQELALTLVKNGASIRQKKSGLPKLSDKPTINV